MNVCVVGAGRMGLPLACRFAERGARVVACDVNAALVDEINAAQCSYEEPGLRDLLSRLVAEGQLTATTATASAVSAADVVVVIVPAHLTDEREIDFRILTAASSEIGKGLQHNTLVIYETTISVGGTRRVLIPALEANSRLVAGRDFQVAYSPERVKANLVLAKLATTPKVVGGLDHASLAKAVDFYSKYLGAPIDNVGTLEAAEMTKLIGMLYRDVNIALANELATFCELASVDFERVRAAANRDGEANLLVPGIGVGGHCTPVYPYFLMRESRRLGMTQRISEAAREINDLQPQRQIERVAKTWKPLRQKRVHILGFGFRPGVKVETLSPAYDMRRILSDAGAVVTIEDPYYEEDELAGAGFTRGDVSGCSLVILNTAHPQFSKPDFAAWHRSGVEAVLDGRNLWNPTDVASAGLLYFGIGRELAPGTAR